MELLSSCRLALQKLRCVWVLALWFDWLSRCLHCHTVKHGLKRTLSCFTSALRCTQASHGAQINSSYLKREFLYKNWIFFSCIFLDAYENTQKAQKTEAFGRNPGWHAAVLHSCVRMKAPNLPNFLSTPENVALHQIMILMHLIEPQEIKR